MPEATSRHVADTTGRKLPHHFCVFLSLLMCQGGYGRHHCHHSANSQVVSVAQPNTPQHQQVLEKLLFLIVPGLLISVSSISVPKDWSLQGDTNYYRDYRVDQCFDLQSPSP